MQPSIETPQRGSKFRATHWVTPRRASLGLLTPSASPRRREWKQLFSKVLGAGSGSGAVAVRPLENAGKNTGSGDLVFSALRHSPIAILYEPPGVALARIAADETFVVHENAQIPARSQTANLTSALTTLSSQEARQVLTGAQFEMRQDVHRVTLGLLVSGFHPDACAIHRNVQREFRRFDGTDGSDLGAHITGGDPRGTAFASIVVGDEFGMVRPSRLKIARVCDDDGGSNQIAWLAALDWLRDPSVLERADVIGIQPMSELSWPDFGDWGEAIMADTRFELIAAGVGDAPQFDGRGSFPARERHPAIFGAGAADLHRQIWSGNAANLAHKPDFHCWGVDVPGAIPGAVPPRCGRFQGTDIAAARLTGHLAAALHQVRGGQTAASAHVIRTNLAPGAKAHGSVVL